MTFLNDLDSALFSTTTTVGFTLLVLLVTWMYFTFRRPKNFPPGPPALPIVGTLPFQSLEADKYADQFLEMHEKYGDVMGLKFGSRWGVLIKDFEVLKEVFVKKGQDFSGRPFEEMYARFRIMNPEKDFGILFSDYTEQWKLQRHTSMTILRNLGYGRNRLQEIIQEEAQELCKVMESKDGQAFNICSLINISVANVICSLLFGERYSHSDEEFAKLRKSVDDAFVMIDQNYEVDFIPFLKHLPYYKRQLGKLAEVYQHLNSVLRQKIQDRKINEEGEPRDFIEGYLRALKGNKNLDDRSFQITQDFFQAGMETTSTTLGWAFYFMLRHPKIQTKVQEELDTVVGQSREVALKDRDDLPYTEACVAETMRLSCTAPLTVDHKVLVDSEVAGYNIPKGTIIWGNLWAILRDSKVFPEPLEFKPERYIQKDGTFHRPEQLINFGIGRRSCLGEQLARQELFLFFTHILQKFRLSVPEGQTHPPPKGIFAFTHRPPVYNVALHSRH